MVHLNLLHHNITLQHLLWSKPPQGSFTPVDPCTCLTLVMSVNIQFLVFVASFNILTEVYACVLNSVHFPVHEQTVMVIPQCSSAR